VVAPLVPDHNSITWVIMVALTLTLKQAPQYKPVGS
jgi:hypothetical protein